jgi:hypothetical protein
VAGEVPITAFVERPKVGAILFMVAALAGVVALIAWMLRPLPVAPAAAAAPHGAPLADVASRITFGTQRAAHVCEEKNPALGAYVQLTVRADGTITDVQALGPFASQETRDCVAREVSLLQVPAIEDGPKMFKQSLRGGPAEY